MQALEKSKYEQSLESVRRFIAIAEKELELYYRHVALYGDPNDRNPLSMLEGPSGKSMEKRNHGVDGKKNFDLGSNLFNTDMSDMEADSTDIELSETEDGHSSIIESDSEEGITWNSKDNEERVVYFSKMQDDRVGTTSGSLSMSKHNYHYNNPCTLSEQTPIARG